MTARPPRPARAHRPARRRGRARRGRLPLGRGGHHNRRALGPDTWKGRPSELRARPEPCTARVLSPGGAPRPVRDAIAEHRGRLDADTAVYLHDERVRLEADVLQAAAGYLGVAPEEIAVTGSTTMGMGLLYATSVEAGRGEFSREHDFYATHRPAARAEATGGSVRRVRLYDEPGSAASGDIVQRVRDAVTPSTRAVALTWVHSSTGVAAVGEIADELSGARRGAGKAQDPARRRRGARSRGRAGGAARSRLRLPRVGCHGRLFGPRGTGIVWGRADAWPEVAPTIPSFTDGESFGAWIAGAEPSGSTSAAAFTPGGYHAFEHRWALAAAFRFRQEVGASAPPSGRGPSQRGSAGPARGPGDGGEDAVGRGALGRAGLLRGRIDGARGARRTGSSDHGVVASVTPYATRYLRFGPEHRPTRRRTSTARLPA